MRVVITDREAALLYRDGRYVGPLEPGVHRFLSPFSQVEVRRVPRLSWMQAGPVETFSADRFPLRLTLGAFCRVEDAKLALDADHAQLARLVLTSGAAQAAADVELDALAVGREALARRVEALVGDAVPGCRLERMQVVGLTLPPEVRRLFTDVERARREAQASLERARGEHAALRSLANAARLLKNNPELATLRILQAVGGSSKATLVLGEGVLTVSERSGAAQGAAEQDDDAST